MTVLGFITEYNPFHYGHKYHLEQSKSITKANYTVAIMSGSFLQRGEPSFVDKWTKAKMAIDNGVDLVLELPFIYACQSAEFFAYGGVKLMDNLNIVDYLSFGSEIGEIDPLKKIASIFLEEPEYFQMRLKHYLSLGYSYSISRSNALQEYISIISPKDKNNYKNIVDKSNNILGIEYLKALKRLNSNIYPVTIKRSGNQYNDINHTNGFASATGIRHIIKTKGLESIKDLVPYPTYVLLQEFYDKFKTFNDLSNFNQILLYLIRTVEEVKLQKYMDIEAGLENRIIQQGNNFNKILDIINNIVTKRYPRTRIQRLLIHLLHELNKEVFMELSESYPSYIRVLGANENGLLLLNRIKERSNLPIITKFADYKKLSNQSLEDILMIDKKSTDIFYLGLETEKSFSNMDYYVSPYIKKNNTSY